MYICGTVAGNNMERFITGEKFRTLADYTFSPNIKRGDDYYRLQDTFNPDSIKDGDIIYSQTGYAQELLNEVAKLNKHVILVTHNGDTNINLRPPGNVIKWFTTNVNIIHPRVESIPIGLENSMWFPGVHKKEKIIARLNEPKRHYNLMYMSHSVATNPETRGMLYDMFEGKSWVTSERGSNRPNLFAQYLNNVDRHKFVISPEGNGMDVHRTWECLHLRTIPIEKRNINNQFYTDLPICFVYEWEEITEDFLNSEYDRITKQDWNMDKITFAYWENKILNTK